MPKRKTYTMSQDDFDAIVGAIQKARQTPLIALNAGMPESPQEAANRAWCALGQKMGFDWTTARPTEGPSILEFSAVPLENSNA